MNLPIRVHKEVDRRLALVHCGDHTRSLSPGSAMSLGRHPLNGLVLSGAQVSRFHATIRWEACGVAPFLLDHGSQNGTLVEGVRVSAPVLLRNGTSIQIGGWSLGIELKHCDDEDAAILAGSDERVALFTEAGPRVQGTVDSGSGLAHVLGRLEAERRTGTLRVVGRSATGEVTLCLGRLMAVELGDAQRTRALEHMLRLRGLVAYELSPQFEPVEEPLGLWFSSYLRERVGVTVRL